VSPRIPSSSKSGDPHYLLSDGYPVWRLPDIKLRHWRPLWGHRHDDRVNSKDLTSKNQSTATAPISNSPTLRIQVPGGIKFELFTPRHATQHLPRPRVRSRFILEVEDQSWCKYLITGFHMQKLTCCTKSRSDQEKLSVALLT
jgi:hypothetical protein